MNPIPSIPMLPTGGSGGRVLVVVGILAALVLMANQKKTAATAQK